MFAFLLSFHPKQSLGGKGAHGPRRPAAPERSCRAEGGICDLASPPEKPFELNYTRTANKS